MSVLPAELHQELTQLLHGLQSPDNVSRTQAEETLEGQWVLPRSDVLLMGLVEQIYGAEDIAVSVVDRPMPLCLLTPVQTRAFAAVLFRRISTRARKDEAQNVTKEVFLLLPEPQRDAIRAKLLQCLTSETSSQVRNKTSDAIAEIARQYTDDGKHSCGISTFLPADQPSQNNRGLSCWVPCSLQVNRRTQASARLPSEFLLTPRRSSKSSMKTSS